MQATEIHEHARKLKEAHGAAAVAEAAQKAAQLEAAGHMDEARNWRRIEKALLEMQGPHES